MLLREFLRAIGISTVVYNICKEMCINNWNTRHNKYLSAKLGVGVEGDAKFWGLMCHKGSK